MFKPSVDFINLEQSRMTTPISKVVRLAAIISYWTNMSTPDMMGKLAEHKVGDNPVIDAITDIEFIEGGEQDIQVNCMVVERVDGRKQGVVAFQSSASDRDWEVNQDWRLMPVGDAGRVQVHRGFWSGLESIYGNIAGYLHKNLGKQDDILVTGFSQGGAQAKVFSWRIMSKLAANVTTIVFGSPRVGNPEFQRELERGVSMVRHYQVGADPVAQLPPRMCVNQQGQLGNRFRIKRGTDRIEHIIAGSGWFGCCRVFCCGNVRNNQVDHDIEQVIERFANV